MMRARTLETPVIPRFILALSVALASSTALAAISECQASCETQYKSCATNRKMTESNCRAQYEKCRKACAKKAGSPAPA